MGVPIDDTHTWHINYDCFVFPPEVDMPLQESVPYAEVPIQDENGNYIVDTVLSQDMVSWYAQGEIADRPGEHLVASDVGVIAYRDFLSEQIEKVGRGEEPINVFHTPEEADRPELRIDGLSEEHVEYTGAPTESVGGSYRVNYHKASKAGPLYIEDNVERYSPDRDVILEAFRQYETVWSKTAGKVLIHSAQSDLELIPPKNE